MINRRSFRWQMIPSALSALIGAVMLPGLCVALFQIWVGILFLHKADWYLRSTAADG